MRVSRAQADENRRRVVDVASELFRERGFEGIGVSDLMKAAGLTHGGFYGNFASKTDLEVEAALHSFDCTLDRLKEAISRSNDALATIVRFYLSTAHRDALAKGCGIAALAEDAARAGPELRTTFERGIRAYLDLLEQAMPESPAAERPARAMAMLSGMVGGLVLARAVDDPALSASILKSTADGLLAGRRAPAGAQQ